MVKNTQTFIEIIFEKDFKANNNKFKEIRKLLLSANRYISQREI